MGLLLLASAPASALDDSAPPAPPEMTVDRPDFTESASIVPAGWVQLEGGFLSWRDPDSRSFAAPLALLRLGLARRFELRLEHDGLLIDSPLDPRTRARHTGVADLIAGAKLQFCDETRLRPALAVLAYVSLPAGSSYFSSGGYDPLVKFAWQKSLPGGFDAGGNFNFTWRTAPSPWVSERAASLSVGHDLARKVSGYAEVYRLSASGGDPARTVANAGLSFAVRSNLQFDVEAGHTVASRVSGWFVGAGFALRAPLTGRARKRRP